VHPSRPASFRRQAGSLFFPFLGLERDTEFLSGFSHFDDHDGSAFSFDPKSAQFDAIGILVLGKNLVLVALENRLLFETDVE